MESRLERQLKKGVLEMLVLQLVCQGPTYGYELLVRMDKISHGFFKVKEGTLYPILYRLEDDGLISSHWQQTESGRAAPKKMYAATPAGQTARGEYLSLWKQLCESVEQFAPKEETRHDIG